MAFHIYKHFISFENNCRLDFLLISIILEYAWWLQTKHSHKWIKRISQINLKAKLKKLSKISTGKRIHILMVLGFDMFATMLRATENLKHFWQRELTHVGLAEPIGWLPKGQVIGPFFSFVAAQWCFSSTKIYLVKGYVQITSCLRRTDNCWVV